MSPEPRHKKRYLKKSNKVTPQAHSRSMIGTIVSFYIQGRNFYLSEQHGFWINCILTERVNNVQNDTNRFCLDVAHCPWTQVHVYYVTWSKSSYTPSCKMGISYTSEAGGKPCRECKRKLSSWLSACAILYFMPSYVFVLLSCLVSWTECRIRFYQFLIIFFSSVF